jgi:ketosteroid isomerase-like protein
MADVLVLATWEGRKHDDTQEDAPMTSHSVGGAASPEMLHALVQDAFGRRDLEAVVAAYDEGAILVVPPTGEVARGREEIRAATERVFALSPELHLAVVGKLETDDLAMTYGRWTLTVDAAGGCASGGRRRWRARVASATRRHVGDRP